MKNIIRFIAGSFHNRFMKVGTIMIAFVTFSITLKTIIDIKPIPKTLVPDAADISRVRVLDRNHVPLTVTYQNDWNTHDYVPLYEIPEFMQQAFIIAEDKRFYSHSGIDRLARLNAAWQNFKVMGGVRGASTITEQVVKMLHPRKRTIWSRWLEGFEAQNLERSFSKAEILEFYLNEVPYASNRRGIVQAARYYFDRDIDTLSRKEMLALAALVRAPSMLDMRKDPDRINGPLSRLVQLAVKQGIMDKNEAVKTMREDIRLKDSGLPVDAGHFVDFVLGRNSSQIIAEKGEVITTLDSSLQKAAKTILDNHMKTLLDKGVKNGAVLAINNRTREILAWVVNGTRSENVQGSWIDAVTALRQPGSTLKPFVYALALEKGWSPATIIEDAPLSEAVGNGLHVYNNYSRIHYGKLPLRQCLGNSLNIPALKALRFTGVDTFLSCLKNMGMQSLEKQPDYYGDGLVLGNGEITLFELVQAYATLASQGVFMPLKTIQDDVSSAGEYPARIFSKEAASLIGNILSDSNARRLEFGSGGVLNFPVQTAVKTGTSNDYRDAWAVGYNNEYTIGVWMGNLDRAAMNKITGAKGPGIVLRSVFAELNRNRETEPLFLSPGLVQMDVCQDTGMHVKDRCTTYSEWFMPGTGPDTGVRDTPEEESLAVLQPSPGLMLAMDPRIPDDHESFMFKLSGVRNNSKVEWYVNEKLTAVTESGDYLWPMSRGKHTVMAKILSGDNKQRSETQTVAFLVK